MTQSFHIIFLLGIVPKKNNILSTLPKFNIAPEKLPSQ